MGSEKARLGPAATLGTQRHSLSSGVGMELLQAGGAQRQDKVSSPGSGVLTSTTAQDGLSTPVGGPSMVTAGGVVAQRTTRSAAWTGGQREALPEAPPLANAVAVLPERGPSRQGPPRSPRSIGKFLPEFQFTVHPSLFRRLLVTLIVACVSPSLLREDPFPPLTLIVSRQALFNKM
ncbi:hypothetical protein ACSSS7_005806 [Eimeria intestinalis]